MATSNTQSSKMTQILIVFVSVLASVICSEHLIVTHSPNYLKFQETGDHIPLTEVPQLVLSTFGFSLPEDLSWAGLPQGSLFKHPRASVLISVDGFKEKSMDINPFHVVKYPVDSDHSTVDTDLVSDHLRRSHQKPLIVDFSRDNTVYDVIAHQPKVFSKLSSNKAKVQEILEAQKSALLDFNFGSLNITHSDDLEILAELQLITEVIDALKSHKDLVEDNSPDFYHFKLGGLRHLVETYGASSPKVRDAMRLITQFVKKVTGDFTSLYNDDVVVEVVTLSGVIDPKAVTRKARSLMQASDSKTPSLEKTIDLGKDYDDDYAAIANIIIWLVIGLAVTIYVISYGLWTMDPGRDSIIYRMTSQRIKKE